MPSFGCDHQRGAVIMVGLADGFERWVGFVVRRKGESLEAIGRGVTQIVLH